MKLHMQILIALGLGIKRNWHILIGLIAGIICGIFLHKVMHAGAVTPALTFTMKIIEFVGQAFIKLIQMVVIPLVFSAIIIGISSIGDNKQLGKIGTKMVVYYGIITILAVVLGLGLALIFKPGVGVQNYISANAAIETQSMVQEAMKDPQHSLLNIFINIIPDNPLKALAEGQMLPIIVFVLIFSFALSKLGEINRPIISFFESVFAATMKITDWIMYLAAPGIFALTATAVSAFGISVFGGILKYILVIIGGCLIQLLIIYPIFMKIFSKVPVLTFYSAIAEAMMVAFGTASSSATLPLTMACCEKRGISNKIASFVLPLGATLNMDATALVQTIAVLFLTQAYGVVLDPVQLIQVAVLAIIASSTCAGIPGAGLITIAVILNNFGLTPTQLVEGFALLFALDRIVDMVRTMNNVTSDAVVLAVIADNENEIDYDKLNEGTSEDSIS